MATDEPDHGPLQLLVVGFETTERFDGEIARELRDLRGRGMIRVVDARLLSRGADGELTETDLNQIIGEPLGSEWRPAAHLFGLNGAGNINGVATGRPRPRPTRAPSGSRSRTCAGSRTRSGRASTRRCCSSSIAGRPGCARWCASAAGGSSPRACSRPR